MNRKGCQSTASEQMTELWRCIAANFDVMASVLSVYLYQITNCCLLSTIGTLEGFLKVINHVNLLIKVKESNIDLYNKMLTFKL